MSRKKTSKPENNKDDKISTQKPFILTILFHMFKNVLHT